MGYRATDSGGRRPRSTVETTLLRPEPHRFV